MRTFVFCVFLLRTIRTYGTPIKSVANNWIAAFAFSKLDIKMILLRSNQILRAIFGMRQTKSMNATFVFPFIHRTNATNFLDEFHFGNSGESHAFKLDWSRKISKFHESAITFYVEIDEFLNARNTHHITGRIETKFRNEEVCNRIIIE